MSAPADISSPRFFDAWCMADEFKSALIELETATHLVDAGLAMRRAGESIRPGSIEYHERERIKAKTRLRDAIAAMRRALDATEREI